MQSKGQQVSRACSHYHCFSQVNLLRTPWRGEFCSQDSFIIYRVLLIGFPSSFHFFVIYKYAPELIPPLCWFVDISSSDDLVSISFYQFPTLLTCVFVQVFGIARSLNFDFQNGAGEGLFHSTWFEVSPNLSIFGKICSPGTIQNQTQPKALCFLFNFTTYANVSFTYYQYVFNSLAILETISLIWIREILQAVVMGPQLAHMTKHNFRTHALAQKSIFHAFWRTCMHAMCAC